MPAIVVMGVSGCGKSSIAAAICRQQMHTRQIEGDQFHSPANVEKMRAGTPLVDEDRIAWLDALADALQCAVAEGEYPVLACSALKRAYRDRLRAAVPQLGFLYLALTKTAAAERVAGRLGHFMPASLIESQFAALENPEAEPLVLTVDASQPEVVIAARAVRWWRDGTPA